MFTTSHVAGLPTHWSRVIPTASGYSHLTLTSAVLDCPVPMSLVAEHRYRPLSEGRRDGNTSLSPLWMDLLSPSFIFHQVKVGTESNVASQRNVNAEPSFPIRLDCGMILTSTGRSECANMGEKMERNEIYIGPLVLLFLDFFSPAVKFMINYMFWNLNEPNPVAVEDIKRIIFRFQYLKTLSLSSF